MAWKPILILSQGPAWDNFKKAHTQKSPQNGPVHPQNGPIRPHPSLHPLRGLPSASGGVYTVHLSTVNFTIASLSFSILRQLTSWPVDFGWPEAEFMNEQFRNFVEVSGHNLESSQTWGFCTDFLNHREGGKVFYQIFLLSPLQCAATNCINYRRLREYGEIEISRQSSRV